MENPVIFDMDGVLVDSEPFHMKMEQKLFRELGISVSAEEHLTYVGITPLLMWNLIRARHGLRLSTEALRDLEMERKYHLMKEMPMSPNAGVSELLAALTGDGHPLALASSSNRQFIELVLDKTGLRPAFESVLGGDEVGAGKPEPDLFLHSADRLGVPPVICTVIEDSTNGILAAKRAGMRCIALRNPHSGAQDLSRADYVVDRFDTETIDRILEWVKE